MVEKRRIAATREVLGQLANVRRLTTSNQDSSPDISTCNDHTVQTPARAPIFRSAPDDEEARLQIRLMTTQITAALYLQTTARSWIERNRRRETLA